MANSKDLCEDEEGEEEEEKGSPGLLCVGLCMCARMCVCVCVDMCVNICMYVSVSAHGYEWVCISACAW